MVGLMHRIEGGGDAGGQIVNERTTQSTRRPFKSMIVHYEHQPQFDDEEEEEG